MKILITGGTGFVGSCLTDILLQRVYDVTVISSSGCKKSFQGQLFHSIQADTTLPGEWQDSLDQYDVIINLAGRTIFHLWTDSYKKEIYASRINTTRNIVSALPQGSNTVFLSASAAGFYGNSGDKLMDESGTVGDDFLAKVCKDWEKEAFKAEDKGCRVAIMRFGVVLGAEGGAIATMKLPFQLGLGGSIGSGKQWFPWIHINDLVNAIVFLMDGSDLQGVYNFTSPGVVRQKDFASTLGKILKRPTFLPVPSIFMKSLLGEFGRSLLMGQKTVPKALHESGFFFQYSKLTDALEEILHG